METKGIDMKKYILLVISLAIVSLTVVLSSTQLWALNLQGLPGDSTSSIRSSVSENQIDAKALRETIEKGKTNILDLKISNTGNDGQFENWNLPSRLGLHYSSQYFLVSQWLGHTPKGLDEAKLKQLIIQDRLPDGSWYAIKDKNLTITTSFSKIKGMTYDSLKDMNKNALEARGVVSFDRNSVTHYKGDLNPSIFHYWALKVMGEKSPAMEDSKNYILSQGGIDKSVIFTKTLLALFGNYPWANIPYIPLALFYDPLQPLVVKQFSQWVIPHLKPLAYMKRNAITKKMGERFDLTELYPQGRSLDQANPVYEAVNLAGHTPFLDPALESIGMGPEDNLLENYIMNEQKPKGSWGGYTLSTLFSIISIDHYLTKQSKNAFRLHRPILPALAGKLFREDKALDFATLKAKGEKQIAKGYEFIETLFFNSPMSNYYGVLDDGSYWDTALMALALLKNNQDPESLRKVGNFLADKQLSNGGFPFGYDFETYPDVDDTAEILWALSYIDGYQNNIRRGVSYLIGEQNVDHDGGWAAFNKGNFGNPLIKILAGKVGDSADLFDESSPDVSGHVLGFLAAYRGDSVNESVRGVRLDERISRGMQYLIDSKGKATQSKIVQKGAWDSRWAINFLFGTESAVSAMTLTDAQLAAEVLAETKTWLTSGIQNADGGFGESTASYTKADMYGKGLSTASQTAWALSTLTDLNMVDSKEARGAVNYLIKEIKTNGKFTDPSVTGTGHPGIIYMEYPSYPYAFPLIAIAKYLNKLCGEASTETVSAVFADGDQGLCSEYKTAPNLYLH